MTIYHLSAMLLASAVLLATALADPQGADAGVAAGLGKLPADAVLLVRTTVHDDQAQLDAGSLLVPDGWKLDANIDWTITINKPVAMTLKISNPNTVERIAFFPERRYMDGFRDDIGRIGGPGAAAKYPDGSIAYFTEIRTLPASPADYVKQYLIPNCRPELAQAKLLEVRNEPDLAKAVALLHQKDNATVQVNRLRFEYPVNGVDCEEDIFCTVASAAAGNGITNWAANAQSCVGPMNKTDRVISLSRAIITSWQTNPPWFAKQGSVQQLAQQIGQQAQISQARRAQILAQAQTTMTQIQQAQMDYAQKLQTQASNKWDDVIRGVDRRYDPIQGRNVETPAGYNNAWTDPQGRQVLSNDPNFDPSALNRNWQKLQPPQPEPGE